MTGGGTNGQAAPHHESAARFAVLGPVRAWCAGRALPSGSPQQRALLAVLLLRHGRTASAHELVGALWGEDPPPQAKAALRTYASRLRKALGERAGALVSEFGGYALRLGPGDELDLDVVRALAADAERVAASGDLHRARDLYGQALERWDGQALDGVPGPEAELHGVRLAELRLGLEEQRQEVSLQAGFHAESVAELTALTTAHPLRERLRELLMLALYRSGRQAEALAVYADARRLLIEELGVEPRPELSDLQRRILNADESLAAPAGGGAARGAAVQPVRPAQLPATVADFTGRAAFVAELGAQLATAGGQVMAVSAVAGIGGVGKTTLAVQVAHAAREHFPDGQLYVDLQGAGTAPSDPATVLGSFLRALGTPDEAVPKEAQDRAGLYRSLLDGRRVLALLDNARDAAQVRPLLPGTPGCAALVTSRARMVDLAGAHLVDLDVMSPDEALTLFTRIVGEERVGAERQAARSVVAACGFLPLALRIAASRLASRRTWTVTALAGRLSDERRRLDELQIGDQAVRATFELGYSQLEREQARAFRLLGLAESPDISVQAAAALLERGPLEAEELLESLVDASLLESAAPGRYRLHDLVRLFARACAERDEQPPAGREAALDRLLDFYLATARTVYALERPGDRITSHLAPTACPGLRFAGHKAALDWLFTESDCLLSCVRQSVQRGAVHKAVDMLLAAQGLAESGACPQQYQSTAEEALAVAETAGETLAEGRARIVLARGHSYFGEFDAADAEGRRALLLGHAAGDPVVIGHALNDRGIIALYQKRYQEAEDCLQQARESFRRDGNPASEASSLSNLSRVRLATGRTGSAVALAEQARGLYQELGSVLRLANADYALGLALTASRRYTEALERLTHALGVFRGNRQRLWTGMTLFRLGQARLAMGEAGEAATLAEEALAHLRDIGGDARRAEVLTTLGEALDVMGQRGRARACWEQALTVFERLGSTEADAIRNRLGSTVV